MPDEPIPPPSDINVPPPDYLQAGKLQAQGSKDSGWLERQAASLILGTVRLAAPLITLLVSSLDELFAAMGPLFLATQGEGARGFADLVGTAMGDLLGVEITGDDIFNAFQSRGRIDAMEVVGEKLIQQLTQEFIGDGEVSPDQGEEAVKTFLGFVMSFAVRQGNVEFILSLLPEELRVFDGFRAFGELMAKNLGLGRLTRMVFKPLLKVLVATPYEWRLNQLYHPTQFTVGDLVNPFQQTQMSSDDIFKAMDLLGYSQDKVEALIKLHQKRLTVDDLDLLQRYGTASQEFVQSYLKTLGWPEELEQTVLALIDLRRSDAAVRALVDTIETSAADGHLTIEDVGTLFDNLPLGSMEKRFRLDAVKFKIKAPHNHLTLAQAQSAFEEGLWTLDQLDTYMTARGYSADDAATLEALTLLKLVQLDEAKRVAQFAYEKKVAAAKAKNQPIPPPPAILAK